MMIQDTLQYAIFNISKVLLAICVLFITSAALSEETSYNKETSKERRQRYVKENLKDLQDATVRVSVEIEKAKQEINKYKQLILKELPKEKQKEAFLKSFEAWDAYIKAEVEYMRSYYESMLGIQWTELLYANIAVLYTNKAEELKKEYEHLKFIEVKRDEYIK